MQRKYSDLSERVVLFFGTVLLSPGILCSLRALLALCTLHTLLCTVYCVQATLPTSVPS